MIPDLDLALLRTFAAIVDEDGLTAAGRIVGRTQPAVSHQLRRLERLVGHKLLVVGRRGVALTHDGEVLLKYARNMLRLNDEARARASAPPMSGAASSSACPISSPRPCRTSCASSAAPTRASRSNCG
jgi:DNA-binding transcriptional LysR family regulator